MKKWLFWLLRLLLVLFFVVAGSEKLRGSWHIVANYEAIGLSMTILYLVGALELAGAVCLLFKRSARTSAWGLVGVTVFTAVSSATAQLWDAVIVAVVVLGLLAALLKLMYDDKMKE